MDSGECFHLCLGTPKVRYMVSMPWMEMESERRLQPECGALTQDQITKYRRCITHTTLSFEKAEWREDGELRDPLDNGPIVTSDAVDHRFGVMSVE